MNKKLIAVAVAGALGVPGLALAQASTVSISGKIYGEYGIASQGKNAAGDLVNSDTLQTPGSELIFKVDEALGGGTSAWFQCASTVDFSGQGTAGFCSRNSGLGVKGNFGSVWFGQWDTPFKRISLQNRIVQDTGLFGTAYLLGGNSATYAMNNLNGVSGGDGVFIRRQSNIMAWDSPSWGGFQLLAMMSNFGASNNSTSISANNQNPASKPRLYSLGGAYANGPLTAGLVYEQHKNFDVGISGVSNTNVPGPGFPGAYGSTDTGWLATVGYVFGPVKVGLIYTQQKFDTSGTTNADRKAWQLAGQWNIMGPHALRAAYTKANGAGGNTPASLIAGGTRINLQSGVANGGSQAQIQYVFIASKRTEFTGGYVQTSEEDKGNFRLDNLTAPTAGTRQSAWGITMTHAF
jgi:hypothetical protein